MLLDDTLASGFHVGKQISEIGCRNGDWLSEHNEVSKPQSSINCLWLVYCARWPEMKGREMMEPDPRQAATETDHVLCPDCKSFDDSDHCLSSF